MPAKFQIKKARNGKFFFNLLAANGEVVMTSQMYASKATTKKGIASVQANAPESGQFAEMSNKAGKHFFVLKAKNRQVIGTSQAYTDAKGMKRGIASVAKNAPQAGIDDAS